MNHETLKAIIEFAVDYAYNAGFTDASQEAPEYTVPEIMNEEVLLSIKDRFPSVELLNQVS